MLAAFALAVAAADPPPELGVVWALTIDGQPVGTRELRVRFEGEPGDLSRFIESWTELNVGRRREAVGYRQRLSADASDGQPASFHATLDLDGEAREVQARFIGGVWRLMVSTPAGTEHETLHPSRVDLSTVDLFDPEAERRLAHYEYAHVLSAEVGRVLEGPVVALGPEDVVVGGETLSTERFEWRTPEATWRFWYASNGFLVKYEAPVLGHLVQAMIVGQVPRSVDEFPIPGTPVIEELDLP